MSALPQRVLRAIILATFILVGGYFTPVQASNWWENIKLKGDFRYRHEIFDKEGSDIRNRQRIRARINMEGKVTDESKVAISISSGSSDPVSNNQTLTDAFSSKDLLIDMAYFELEPKAMPGLKILGGKTDNPFYKPGNSELLWDSDLRPEGMTFDYNRAFENISMELIGSGQWIMARGSGDDSYLAAGQAIFTYHMPEKRGAVTLGGSYFSYGNAKGYPVFFEADDPKGNLATAITVDDVTTYYYSTDFELIEAFGEINLKAGYFPITLIGDYVTNTAADSLKKGWLVGIYVGKAKKVGTWDFRYIYRELEKDAVVGIFTDSDFRGGGTDARGHEIGASYQLMNNTTLAATYFNNQIGLEQDNRTDFQRWQFDFILKF